MSLLYLLLLLVILGACWYAVTRFLSGTLALLAKIVIVVVAVYYVLLALGLLEILKGITVPHA